MHVYLVGRHIININVPFALPGAFSVSPAHVESLKRYIANQEEHHRSESFQDEFRRLLRKYSVPYDERYVWD